MHSVQFTKKAPFVVVGLLVFVAGAGPLSAQSVPDAQGLLCDALPVDPLGGCVVWEDRFDGPSLGDDGPTGVTVSPDGSRVFVSGFSYSRPPGTATHDYVTVGYDARTGDRLWFAEYEGPDANGDPAAGEDFAMAVDVSPDSATVYVTGGSFGFVPALGVSATGVATIAYDTATGATKWVARYQGAGLSGDLGRDVAASPDGARVYVLATLGGANNQDVGLLTFDAGTGQLLNDDVYNGPADRHDSVFFRSLAVAPNGEQVFVGAQSYTDTTTGYDYALLRYDAAGALAGVSRYDAGEGNVERPFAIDVAPDGAQVYITGRSRLASSDYDFATVAFDAAGAQKWVARYDGEGLADEAYVVKASPDGAFVAVTGTSVSDVSGYDYATVVYDAATGNERWNVRHSGAGAGNDLATGLAIDPASLRVFVTGYERGAGQDLDTVTLAYDVLTGSPAWTHTYLSSGQADDMGRDVTVAPDGSMVFVTGDTYTNPTTTYDIATFAISANPAGPLPLP